MIVITGATGHLGKATIDFLLKKGVKANAITALVRDEEKAIHLKEKGIRLVKGDYENYISLVAAFHGADKLFFVSSNDMTNRKQQHENIVKAAMEAGVGHVVYTSITRKTEDGASPIAMITSPVIETEKSIRQAGFNYTILRNGLYADVLPVFLGEQVLSTGVYFPTGEGKASFATRQDLAEASAAVLTGTGHENKEYALANEVNYSLQDAATILSELSGKLIPYVSPAADIYSQTLTRSGVPAEYIGFFVTFAEAIKQGEFETNKTDLTQLLGRKPTTLKEFLQLTYFNK